MNKLDDTTSLAVMRTRLAAERTLMAWIRTAFTLIGFGFGIMKFFQYLALDKFAHPVGMKGIMELGIMLILLGILSLILGMIEHRKAMNSLSKLDGKSKWSYAFVVGIFIGLVGIFVLTRAVTVKMF